MGYGQLLLSVKSDSDNYLVGNPQFTYFKSVYKRHTNFSIDYQSIKLYGDTENVFGKKLYINVPKNGDLVHRMFLTFEVEVGINADLEQIAPLGYNYIDYIELYIGGQLIDKHTGEYLAIYHEQFSDSSKSIGIANMVGIQNNTNDSTKKLITLPLRFWFNNDVGLSLPLIALQYSDIKIDIKFNDKNKVNKFSSSQPGVSGISINNIALLSEYIFLDKEERNMFSSKTHEYLITQLQSSQLNTIPRYTELYSKYYDPGSGIKKEKLEKLRFKVNMRFSYPIKQIIWGIQDLISKKVSNNTPSIYMDYENEGIFKYNMWNNHTPGSEQMTYCNIIINNKELMEEMPADFFRYIQPITYGQGHGINYIDLNTVVDTNNPKMDELQLSKGLGFYSYSFALKPKNFQPSGSLNFSKLDNIQLKFGIRKTHEKDDTTDNINQNSKMISLYAINYNILKISSGMCGLAFMN